LAKLPRNRSLKLKPFSFSVLLVLGFLSLTMVVLNTPSVDSGNSLNRSSVDRTSKFGPIPVPPPRSQPSKFQSAVISETIPISGWDPLPEVSFAPPPVPLKGTEQPVTSHGFLPSAVGFSGLVIDEYNALPRSVRSDVSLPEYEFYHYVIWWLRVYHVYQNSSLHPPSSHLAHLDFSRFELLDLPLACSVYQHLSSLGDIDLDGKSIHLQPPLLSDSQFNPFGITLPELQPHGLPSAYTIYQWYTAPVLLRQIVRLRETLFPNESFPPVTDDQNLSPYVHTSLLDSPGCYGLLRHRHLFLDYLAHSDPKDPNAILTTLHQDSMFSLLDHIGDRLSVAYPSRSITTLSSFGNALQLTFSNHLSHTSSDNPKGFFTLIHDREAPSSPDFGFIPECPEHISAAIRLDFNPSIPDAIFVKIDRSLGNVSHGVTAQSFWQRYQAEFPIPLLSTTSNARKFTVPVAITDIRLPVPDR
jgi:hypothetical protein